jgi:L-serine dehydratase
MDIGILDVLGPVMIGPSSSHTAGALRLARAASIVAEKSFDRIAFGLHGSFADTAAGHGTDKALLAGALGYHETDPAIKDVFQDARARGIGYRYDLIDLGTTHENSCRITFYHHDGSTTNVTGSSVGGGQILITDVDGFKTEITALNPTLLIWQRDRQGVISAIPRVIADHGINIAVVKLGRIAKGDVATTVIETDGEILHDVVRDLLALDNILGVRLINL